MLAHNRFARDQRGQLFDLATGRDVPESGLAVMPEAQAVEGADELARATGEVLEAGGLRVHAVVVGAGEAGAAAESFVAGEAARRGCVPVSLAGLRRLPAAGALARRSVMVMATCPSTPGADALIEGTTVLLAMSALRAKPVAVTLECGLATGTTLGEAAAARAHTTPWRVAERSLLRVIQAVDNAARSRRRMQAKCGFHRRRGECQGFLEAALSLAQAHLERGEPRNAANIARGARTWRGWWAGSPGTTVENASRVLALLDIEATARLASIDFDGAGLAVELQTGQWVARALGLTEFHGRLSIHLAVTERRAGRLGAARLALDATRAESLSLEASLRWAREALWVGMSRADWHEAGRAAHVLRRLVACGVPAVTAAAGLELAAFHLRIGDDGTARMLLGEHRSSLDALSGPERARFTCVRHLARRAAHTLGAVAHAAPRKGDPWHAIRREYALLTGPRRVWRGTNGVAEGPVPGMSRRAPWEGEESAMEDVLELLRVCHDAEDDQRGLGRMCLLVRERLGATAVGVWATRRAEPLAGAGTGRSWPVSLAERARTTGLPHGPEAAGNAVEAAWPVTHAGTPIGVVACRWLADHPIDRARTEIVLRAAAAACVPLVRGTIDATTPERSSAGGEMYGLVGDSEAIRVLRGAIRRAAHAPFHVLIEGESGSGKELVARAIHDASARRQKRFCAINCAALTDELLEAELFGHTRGAFTGALAERAGLFEDASGGTLFLDEVADLSPRGQAKVLRVLQDGEVRRIGENFSRRVDVRIVAATNKALRDEVARGHFRQDLRYRLDVLRLTIPPLRERRSDVALLAAHFWRDAAARVGSRAVLDASVLAALSRYDWPGNVRELQNVMATVAVHAPVRGRVGLAALPRTLPALEDEAPVPTLEEARRRFEAQYVRHALARAGGCRAQAARALGLTRQGFAKLVDRLGLDSRVVSSP